MTILAVMPYAGSSKLTDMAARCLRTLRASISPAKVGVEVKVVAVANDPARLLTEEELGGAQQIVLPKNIGFGPGINEALRANDFFTDLEGVLVLNSDLVFEDENWLEEILEQQSIDRREGFNHFVYAPCTDHTATKEAIAEHEVDKPPISLRQVSAYCWLVPATIVRAVEARFGSPLFPPQFPNYGSDDAAACWFRSIYGARPFQLVRRSWVRHLKGRTANELGVKPATAPLLAELKNWMSKNKFK